MDRWEFIIYFVVGDVYYVTIVALWTWAVEEILAYVNSSDVDPDPTGPAFNVDPDLDLGV